MEKAKIVKVKKNSTGDITDVMISTGNIFSINEAIALVNDGVIEGVNINTANDGKKYILSSSNETEIYNLPTF
jgi:hypothetical protein